MSEKKTESFLTLREIVAPYISPEFIVDHNETSFKLTRRHKATNKSQVVWLEEELEKWKKNVERSTHLLSFNFIEVHLDKKSIEIGMKIKGFFKVQPEGNQTFDSNLSAMIRKVLAQLVEEFFPFDIDFDNILYAPSVPIQFSLHLYWPMDPEEEKARRKILSTLIENPDHLDMALSRRNAFLIDPKVALVENGSRIAITTKFKSSVFPQEARNLEELIQTFFEGMGFTMTGWRKKTLDS